MTNKETALCQECETPLYHEDRINKKFCNLKCKNRFHNRIQRDKRKIRRKVDHALHRNHDLLIEFHPQKKVLLAVLKVKGFSEHTYNRIADSNNCQWRICYNYAFRQEEKEQQSFIIITKIKSYEL